jgi:hypothetical protein
MTQFIEPRTTVLDIGALVARSCFSGQARYRGITQVAGTEHWRLGQHAVNLPPKLCPKIVPDSTELRETPQNRFALKTSLAV